MLLLIIRSGYQESRVLDSRLLIDEQLRRSFCNSSVVRHRQGSDDSTMRRNYKVEGRADDLFLA